MESTLTKKYNEKEKKEIIEEINNFKPLRSLQKVDLSKIRDTYFKLSCFDFPLFKRKLEENSYKRRHSKVIATYYPKLNYGGTERVVSNLTNIWLKQGYKVILLTEENTSKEDYKIDKRIIRIVIPKVEDRKKRDEEIINAVEKYKIKTILYNDYWSQGFYHDLILYKLLGLNYIFYFHYTVAYCLYILDDLKKIEYCSLAKYCLVLTELDYSFFSKFNKNTLLTINPCDYYLTNKNADIKSNKIIWIGRAEDNIKKVNDIIEICQFVKNKIEDFKFVIIGQLDENFVKKISELGLENHFELIGKSSEPFKYYLDAGIYLSTSLSESFSLSTAEAFSFSLPTVAYDIPYLPFFKSKGVICVEPRNTEQAANAICELLLDKKKAAAYGKTNKRFLKRMCRKNNLYRLWKKILNPHFSSIHQNIKITSNGMANNLFCLYKEGINLYEKNCFNGNKK